MSHDSTQSEGIPDSQQIELPGDNFKVRISPVGVLLMIALPSMAYGAAFLGWLEEGEHIAIAATTVLYVAVVVRAIMVSAIVDSAGVTTRNFWATTHTPWSDIERITCSEYHKLIPRAWPGAVGLRRKGFEKIDWETFENTLTVKATVCHYEWKRDEIVAAFRAFAEVNGVPCNVTPDDIKGLFSGCQNP